MKGPRIWFVITRVRYTDKICKEFVWQFVIPGSSLHQGIVIFGFHCIAKT